jgi:predicted Holliday junction resolvase-like endonuclease
MIEWAAVLACLLIILYLVWKYLSLLGRVEARAQALHDAWRAGQLEQEARTRAEILFREWAISEEARIRKDAIGKSEAVIRGKVTEHLAPFFPGFPYDPRDARFLGTPVDFVVFHGLSSGDLSQVVFIEVKTGKTGALSPREQQVKECVGDRKVRYEVLHLKGQG